MCAQFLAHSLCPHQIIAQNIFSLSSLCFKFTTHTCTHTHTGFFNPNSVLQTSFSADLLRIYFLLTPCFLHLQNLFFFLFAFEYNWNLAILSNTTQGGGGECFLLLLFFSACSKLTFGEDEVSQEILCTHFKMSSASLIWSHGNAVACLSDASHCKATSKSYIFKILEQQCFCFGF